MVIVYFHDQQKIREKMLSLFLYFIPQANTYQISLILPLLVSSYPSQQYLW